MNNTGINQRLQERTAEFRVIDPELQRFVAKRMHATSIELASSHVSLLSHPKEVADLIIKAAHSDR